MDLRCSATVSSASKMADGSLSVALSDGTAIEGVDCLLAATGRKPLLEPLGLGTAGVELSAKGFVAVNEYQQTNVPGMCARALPSPAVLWLDQLGLTPCLACAPSGNAQAHSRPHPAWRH